LFFFSLFSSHSISSPSSSSPLFSPIIPAIVLFLLLSFWRPHPHKALSLSGRNIFLCLSSAPRFRRLVSRHVLRILPLIPQHSWRVTPRCTYRNVGATAWNVGSIHGDIDVLRYSSVSM
jgi:hypothetical protein